jgi:hypothetical protein
VQSTGKLVVDVDTKLYTLLKNAAVKKVIYQPIKTLIDENVLDMIEASLYK